MPAGRTTPLRRSLAGLVAAALVSTGLAVALATPASAATRAFTPAYTVNTNGDVFSRGNALMTCPNGATVAGGSATCSTSQTGGSQQNNNYLMSYVDIDGDPSTFDSSSAAITIPSGATVLYAGLSWGANTTAGTSATYPAINGVAPPNAALKNVAKFKAPGASTYTAVTSTKDDTNGTGTTGAQYQAYAEVTSTVAAAGSGSYTVADVQAGTGADRYAGWSLTIAYRDATLPYRNLVVFTGFDAVSGAGTSIDLPVSGFTTPASGPVVTRLGVVAYEGDKGSTGDSMALGGTNLSNSLNPVNDVFNSSLTDLNVAVTDRTPSYANMLGYDIDRFDASGILGNGATSTVIHLTTGGETYNPGLLTFATDLTASAVTATMTATDVNGGTLGRNDRLNYSITLNNTGDDAAVASVLSDALPVGTTYVPGSLVIGGAAVTDATGDDAGDVTTGNVTARFGTGATSTAGGRLAPAATTTVAFAVTVDPSGADGASIVNKATIAYNSQTVGTGYNGASNTVTNPLVVPPSFTLSAPLVGEVGAPYSATPARNGGTGTAPYTWSISAGSLPAGVSLDSSTGAVTGTPTTAGTYGFTILLTDVNNRTGNRSVTGLVIAAAPTLTYAAPPTGEVNTGYNYQLTQAGGTGPYVWTISSGSLPAGVTLNGSTGLLSGTPTSAGSSTFAVLLTDANSQTASRSSTIQVIAGPALTYPAPAGGEVGVSYTTTFTAAGGTTPYTWSKTTGSFPAGLTFNTSTGVLTGTPTTAGTSSFTIKVVDTNGQIDSQTSSITVVAAVTLTFPAPPAAQLGTAYSQLLTRSGGTGPYAWSVSTGTLPAALTLDPASGLLSGTPTALGTSTFTVRVTDALGGVDTRAVSFVVDRSTATLTTTVTDATVQFGTSVTLTATAGPTSSTGTVTFTDQAPTGSPVTLGTAPLSGGVSNLTVTLPAFGLNSVTASYAGDATHAPATASALAVEVNAYLGEVIVTEFRASGPNGADDSYVELFNTGPAAPLAGFSVVSSSGTTTTLPAGAPTLGTGRSYLLTGGGYSLGATGTSDRQVTTLGDGGLKVLAPDTDATRTDAVGPASGFHRGTAGLPELAGTPIGQYAWWRLEKQGQPVDTGRNALDFQLVSKLGGLVGGQQSTLGAPSPTGTTDPYQHNATLQSTLLDPAKDVTAIPNRVYVPGIGTNPGTLTIRRRITNTTGATVTAAVVRTTSLSEAHGQPQPGVTTQPTSKANLRATNPSNATSTVTITSGSRTVHNLSVDAPNTVTDSTDGGGLNSTFTIPLPGGGLTAGATLDIAFTFNVDTRGTFWFGYDIDAQTSGGGARATLLTRTPANTPGDNGQLR